MEEIAVRQDLIRITNQKLIMDYLRKNDIASRTLLSSALKLSMPSVSDNIEKLISFGLVVQDNEAMCSDKNIGRRPVSIKLNSDFARFVSIDLSGSPVKVAVTDFSGNDLVYIESEPVIDMEAIQIIEIIIDTIKTACELSDTLPSQVKVMVVSSPGIFNETTQSFVFSNQLLGWDKVNIKKELNAVFDAHIIVINDINAKALGELEFGFGLEQKNFALIHLDVGIGMGIILNGALYSGTHNAAGEIGFSLLSLPNSSEGAKREFESLASFDATKKEICKKLNVCKKQLTPSKISSLYAEGNPVVVDAVNMSLHRISAIIANINAILDLPLIVLFGEFTELSICTDEIIQKHISGITPYTPEVKISRLGDAAAIKGSYILAFEYILDKYL